MSSLEKQGEQVWRSLGELEGGPLSDNTAGNSIGGNEFPEGAGLPPDQPSRRHFLKLMAAGTGLAGLTSCRWPKENILPYARRPPEIIPGNPIYFATSTEVAGRAQGLVVTSFDGRPIKIDGNEQHPNNRGGTDAQTQASILDLYDPDRSKNPVQLQGRQPFDQRWEDFDAFAQDHFTRLRQAQGKGLYVLAEATSSPSVRETQGGFLKALPQAKWYEYEPISPDNGRDGSALAYGAYYRTHYRFDRAAVVVSLDADFLINHPAALAYARDFIAAHTPPTDNKDSATAMSRLYVAESLYTCTGVMADNRLAVPAGEVGQVAWQLAGSLAAGGLEATALYGLMASAGTPSPFVRAAAKDLLANRGRSIVIVGERQPSEVHALAHLLNQALGNVGQTVWFTADPELRRVSHLQAMGDLVREMREGRVETLVILGGNPVYNCPADMDFATALAGVRNKIHLSLYWDETSQMCNWHLPRAHYLETWGDTRAYDGTYGVAQPLIRPLYDGRSEIELLSQLGSFGAGESATNGATGRSLGGAGRGGHEIVRATARSLYAGQMNDEQFEMFWRELLHNGVLPKSQLEPQQPILQAAAIGGAIERVKPRAALGAENLEIVFREDTKIHDGRFANNGWLQELPEAMTKVTWDNAVIVGPETAKALGVGQGQVVAVQRAGGRITGPVYILPGTALFSVSVSLGYGRKAAGSVGSNIGFNAYPLRTSQAMHMADGVTVRPAGRTYTFATTQEHWPLDKVGQEGMKVRLPELVAEMTLAEYRQGAAKAMHREREAVPEQLWKGYEYNNHRWGMAIDMQKCIGCNACVVACQAENNSPVVGRDQVRRGREMQWLRIDRYFRGAAAAQVSFQPIFCVHCENAPCESVCPVAATLHDSDGLNLMVYNRCVGTRYCSNNCPYKVRRFNFFHYSKNPPLVRQMQYNPNVTVRSRGVMEKCTYCVQRIQQAKIVAKNERRALRDGEFTTACGQACPTGAIVFGDLNDPESRVARLHRDSRSYSLLEEINTRPRSWHMARVRNPGAEGAEHT